jgi:hypothetical protein
MQRSDLSDPHSDELLIKIQAKMLAVGKEANRPLQHQAAARPFFLGTGAIRLRPSTAVDQPRRYAPRVIASVVKRTTTPYVDAVRKIS